MDLLRCSAAVALLLTGVNAMNSSHEDKGIHAFGPANCIQLTRTPAGTCMVSTNCQGQDISMTEFAFHCVNPFDHSSDHHFGTGGFEDNEDFDTGVKCTKCLSIAKTHKKHRSHHRQHIAKQQEPGLASRPSLRTRLRTPQQPPKLQQHQERLAVERKPQKKEQARAPTGQSAEAESQIVLRARLNEAEKALRQDQARVVSLRSQLATKELPKPAQLQPTTQAEATRSDQVNFALHRAGYWPFKGDQLAEHLAAKKYGPNNCIKIWRNEVGHCVIKTKCEGENMENYEYGLTCVGDDGVMTRHTFGKDSFDPEENFDTLISCSKCLPAASELAVGGDHDSRHAMLMHTIHDLHEDINDLASNASSIEASISRLKRAVREKKGSAPAGLTPGGSPAPAPKSAIQESDDADDAE